MTKTTILFLQSTTSQTRYSREIAGNTVLFSHIKTESMKILPPYHKKGKISIKPKLRHSNNSVKFDQRHDICGPGIPRAGAGEGHSPLRVLDLPQPGLRLSRSRAALYRAQSIRHAPQDAGDHPPVSQSIKVCVRMDDGTFSDWFDVGQGFW